LASTPSELMIFPSAVSLEMCDAIVRLGDSLDLAPGKVTTAGGVAVNEQKRTDQIGLVPSNNETAWLYDELWSVILELNSRNWNFSLTAIETLQYSAYGQGHFFGWHRDNMGATHRDLRSNHPDLTRKLSLSVQLSDPSEYGGGYFEVNQNEAGDEEAPDSAGPSLRTGEMDISEVSRPRGTIIAFPSVFRHRVTPIEFGTRRALVAWAGGPTDAFDNY